MVTLRCMPTMSTARDYSIIIHPTALLPIYRPPPPRSVKSASTGHCRTLFSSRQRRSGVSIFLQLQTLAKLHDLGQCLLHGWRYIVPSHGVWPDAANRIYERMHQVFLFL